MKTQVSEVRLVGRDEPISIRDELGQLKKKFLLNLLTDKSNGQSPIVPDSQTLELLAESLDEISRLKKNEKLIRAQMRQIVDMYENLNSLFYDTLMCHSCEDLAISYNNNGSVRISKLSDVEEPVDEVKKFSVVLLDTVFDDPF